MQDKYTFSIKGSFHASGLEKISFFIYLLKPICLITVLLIIFVSLRKISFKLITPNSEFSCSMFGKLSRSYKCEKKFKQTVIKISTLLLFFFFFFEQELRWCYIRGKGWDLCPIWSYWLHNLWSNNWWT